MNWNNNDTKYILKRVIVYFVIACILFFAGQRCAKAAVSTVGYDQRVQSGNTVTVILQGQLGKGMGQGWAIGSFWVNPSGLVNYGIAEITATVIEGNNQYIMECELGNASGYVDNTNQWQSYSYKCPANLGANSYIGYITARKTTADNNPVYSSQLVTFVTESNEANQIVSGINNAINNMNTQSQVNAQTIQNAINTATQNEINAINNQTTAINDNTQAINDLTDTINANYNTSTGSDYLDVFDNLFTQQDENVIRQFVMIPFNLYILLYNAITSGSCQSISLGALYGVNLDLPCINLRQILGVGLYTLIDTIFGACLLFGIVRMIKKFFNSLFSISSKATDECGIEVFK